MPVLCPTYTALEYNGKIRPQPEWENSFSKVSGGAVRRMRTSLRKDGEAAHYAAPS